MDLISENVFAFRKINFGIRDLGIRTWLSPRMGIKNIYLNKINLVTITGI
jgi:hypothetical protein